jgi:hypothetical protein
LLTSRFSKFFVIVVFEKKNEGKTEALKERKGETLGDLHKQQALIWEERPERDPHCQSSTLRGKKACFSHRLGFLSIAWRERVRSEGLGLERRIWGRCWTVARRPLGLGSFVCCFSLLSSGVAIFISVFLGIPTVFIFPLFQETFYMRYL